MVNRKSIDPVRIGFSINKKTGNAVKRNRIRRRVKEIIRKMEWKENTDLVFKATKRTAEADYGLLKEEIEDALKGYIKN